MEAADKDGAIGFGGCKQKRLAQTPSQRALRNAELA